MRIHNGVEIIACTFVPTYDSLGYRHVKNSNEDDYVITSNRGVFVIKINSSEKQDVNTSFGILYFIHFISSRRGYE